MSTINVDSILPQSGNNVEVNKIVIKDVVNGPFILYGGTEYNANASTGAGSTIVGNGAMLSSSGVSNTAIGANSLRNNTTGSLNTAVGREALLTNVSGGGNTAVGYAAMQNTTGSVNTALGWQSLPTGSGQENVAIGASAGFSLTTGSFNVIVGTSSGADITTGNNNIVLGDDTQVATPTTSNSITLGNGSHNVLRCAVTSITSLSDERDKKEIETLPVGLDFINSLKPVSFVWNERTENGKHDIKDFGFIAQDLKKSQEDIQLADTLKLVYEENPEKLEASYGKLVPILVKAIQELSNEINILKNK